jgi:6-pyruvoyltetrahydropterin/6-carboxytetrahydropterin synthase
MYTVSVKDEFIARHFLIGGDWGPENEINSHHYEIEVLMEGPTLDQHGFLVDIEEVENVLEKMADSYSEQTLNDLPEFEGLNPSMEHLSRILCAALTERIKAPNLSAITVRVWEDADAWASFRNELG